MLLLQPSFVAIFNSQQYEIWLLISSIGKLKQRFTFAKLN